MWDTYPRNDEIIHTTYISISLCALLMNPPAEIHLNFMKNSTRKWGKMFHRNDSNTTINQHFILLICPRPVKIVSLYESRNIHHCSTGPIYFKSPDKRPYSQPECPESCTGYSSLSLAQPHSSISRAYGLSYVTDTAPPGRKFISKSGRFLQSVVCFFDA
ncbi:hypothetical protein EK904_011664 [Melospiza melodia maxima]|nr:hypothetical protein EK904_011664 [Melospiza melodia maxima]